MTEWILTSSVLILLVLAVRGLFKNKMKAKAVYALWLIVLVRLLCPVNFGELSFNLLSLAEEGKAQVKEHLELQQAEKQQESQQNIVDSEGVITIPDKTTVYHLPEVGAQEQKHAETPVVAPEIQTEATATVPAEEPAGFLFPEISWQKVLPYVWIIGMVCMVVVIFGVNISFSTTLGMLRKELPLLARKGRGKKELSVYLADGINSSCLYGVIHPSIYLNEQGMNDREKTYCVEHEYSHYLQGDMVWSLCRTICLVLHWYNPLVWVAVILSKKDAELASDERTIERLGEEERYSYGHTLVELAAKQSKAVQMFGMATLMASDKKEVVERVKAITTKKRTKLITGLLVAALVVGIGFFVFTGEAKGEQDNNKKNAPVATVTPMPTLIVDDLWNMEDHQSFENHVLENNEFPVEGLVTAGNLNVRRGAGYNYDKTDILPKDTPVLILDTEQNGDVCWYKISYGEGKTGYVVSSYITWAGSFRLYEKPEENSPYIVLDFYPEAVRGIADAGSEWFYTETWNYQSGWIRYGEHGGVDDKILELLRITESEWEKNREEKKKEIVLTLTEEVNYTPLSFVDHVALEQIPGEGWLVDLNGDGEQEKLYINEKGVYINGEKKFMFSNKKTFWMLDIDTTDKMYELLTSGGDLYIYDGAEFQCVKGIQEIYFADGSAGTIKTFKRYFGTLNEFTRIDEHTISFEDCFLGWHRFFAEAQYTLDENHNLQPVPQEYEIRDAKRINNLFCFVDAEEYSPGTSVKKIKLYEKRNAESAYEEVFFLEGVTLLKTDLAGWYYLETEDGKKGWINREQDDEKISIVASDMYNLKEKLKNALE